MYRNAFQTHLWLRLIAIFSIFLYLAWDWKGTNPKQAEKAEREEHYAALSKSKLLAELYAAAATVL